jgi:hypothetical protein
MNKTIIRYDNPQQLPRHKLNVYNELVDDLAIAFSKMITLLYDTGIDDIPGYPFALSFDEYDGRTLDMKVKPDMQERLKLSQRLYKGYKDAMPCVVILKNGVSFACKLAHKAFAGYSIFWTLEDHRTGFCDAESSRIPHAETDMYSWCVPSYTIDEVIYPESEQTLNDKYGVDPRWKLRLRYSDQLGTYLEGYSEILDKWIAVKRVSLTDIT